MVEKEAAQRGVLQAIVDLHNEGMFTAVLDDFYRSVLPRYFALDLPDPPLFNPVPKPQLPIGRYERRSRDRRQRLSEFEYELQQWARQFRLTHDWTKTGEPFPWILEFGRRACKDRTFTIPSVRRSGPRSSPPWGLPVDGPKPDERFPAWLARIRRALRAWYSLMRKQRRSRAYSDPAKRNQDHYRWFVLRMCGDITPTKLLEVLEIRDSDESTIRRAVKEIRDALSLGRQ
jgi:hypothetical protein